MLWLALILAAVMGLLLGLLGGGGSILAVPILVYVLDLAEKQAIATSLVVVGITSAVALISHARAGNVAWKIGGIFGAFGMAGAFAAGNLARFIPGTWLLILFALLMLVTAVAMLRPARSTVGPAVAGDRTVPRRAKELPFLKIALEGLSVGAVTGLVGAGGGFLVVPALVLLSGLSMKRAIGTSLLVISMKSFAGFAGFAGHVDLDVSLTLWFVLAALGGTLIGSALTRHLRSQWLRRGFAVFVLLMAVFILIREVLL